MFLRAPVPVTEPEEPAITPGRTVGRKGNTGKNKLGNKTRRQKGVTLKMDAWGCLCIRAGACFVPKMSRWLPHQAPCQEKDLHMPSELYQNHRRHIGTPKPRLVHTHRPRFWCFPGVQTWRRRRGSRRLVSSLPGWHVRSCGCEFGTRRADPAPRQPETLPPRTWFHTRTQTDGWVYLPAVWRVKGGDWRFCGKELHKWRAIFTWVLVRERV